MVVSPRYLNRDSDKNFANIVDVGRRINIPCFGGEQEVAFFHEYRAGVDWVFTTTSRSLLFNKLAICHGNYFIVHVH